MKKRLFKILALVVGATFMVSCGGGDDPAPVFDTVANRQILEVMQQRYLWKPGEPSLAQETTNFFRATLNSNDPYSRIWSTSTPVTTSYDPGFEFAINNYSGNLTYYVVLYVRPNTPAANDGVLFRGLYITEVNDTPVTAANAATLLPNAYKEGKEVRVKLLSPIATQPFNGKFTPVVRTAEAPMLTSNVLTAGTKKVGYIIYNNFSAGTNSANDNALAAKLAEFKNQNVTELVFDVRYNAGGELSGVQALGSALVKNRNVNNPFIQQVFGPGATTPFVPLNFVNKTNGGTAVPTLGDQLNKIYIITGQTTAGAAEAFVNALKAYRASDIILVGEKSRGFNVATATVTENNKIPSQDPTAKWNMQIAYLYMADANKNYNYTAGFAPTSGWEIQEVKVAALNSILLGELGTKDEVILSKILASISGTKSTLSVETRSTGFERPLQTSLDDRISANQTIVELY